MKSDILTKTDAQIERDTAKKWLDRAVDAFSEYAKHGDAVMLQRAASYEDEALEHAALVKDFGKTVKAVQKTVMKARKKAGV